MFIGKQTLDEGQTESFIEVIAPIEDTPAYEAGIEPGDLIVEVEGESTLNLTVDEVVNRLRGRPNSPVNFIVRRGRRTTFPIRLVRDIIEVPSVKKAMVAETIGYLRIINFTPFTHTRVREAIEFFKDENYRAMIIDLRSNPGGLLSGVVDTVDLFFDEGLIVETRGRVLSETKRFNAREGKLVNTSLPIVVLIDRGTASAAEIMQPPCRTTNGRC